MGGFIKSEVFDYHCGEKSTTIFEGKQDTFWAKANHLLHCFAKTLKITHMELTVLSTWLLPHVLGNRWVWVIGKYFNIDLVILLTLKYFRSWSCGALIITVCSMQKTQWHYTSQNIYTHTQREAEITRTRCKDKNTNHMTTQKIYFVVVYTLVHFLK